MGGKSLDKASDAARKAVEHVSYEEKMKQLRLELSSDQLALLHQLFEEKEFPVNENVIGEYGYTPIPPGREDRNKWLGDNKDVALLQYLVEFGDIAKHPKFQKGMDLLLAHANSHLAREEAARNGEKEYKIDRKYWLSLPDDADDTTKRLRMAYRLAGLVERYSRDEYWFTDHPVPDPRTIWNVMEYMPAYQKSSYLKSHHNVRSLLENYTIPELLAAAELIAQDNADTQKLRDDYKLRFYFASSRGKTPNYKWLKADADNGDLARRMVEALVSFATLKKSVEEGKE